MMKPCVAAAVAVIATALCLACSAADKARNEPWIYNPDKTLPPGCWDSVWWLENAKCTAVFVGKDVFMTAKHCVNNPANQNDLKDMEEYAFAFGDYSPPSQWRCHRLENEQLDVGVCLRKDDGPTPKCFETVDLDKNNIKLYGQVYAAGASFFYHDSAVHRGVSATWSKVDNSDQSTLTLVSKGGACYGDSGGPILSKHSSVRKLVGLIHGGGCDKTGFEVTALSANKVSKYLADWSKANQANICGVNGYSAAKCVTTW